MMKYSNFNYFYMTASCYCCIIFISRNHLSEVHSFQVSNTNNHHHHYLFQKSKTTTTTTSSSSSTALCSGNFQNGNMNEQRDVGVYESNRNPFENVSLDPAGSDSTSSMVPFNSYETTGGTRNNNNDNINNNNNNNDMGGGPPPPQQQQQQQQQRRNWYEPYGQSPRYAHQQRIQQNDGNYGQQQQRSFHDPYQPSSAGRQQHPKYQQQQQFVDQLQQGPSTQRGPQTFTQQQQFYEPYRPSQYRGGGGGNGGQPQQQGVGGNYRQQSQSQQYGAQPWYSDQKNQRNSFSWEREQTYQRGGQTGVGNGGGAWWQSSVDSTNSLIQGNSRRTWSSNSYSTNNGYGDGSSDVLLQSQDPYTPLDATVNIWNGPDNTARKMKVYSEDGYLRPLRVNFKNYNPTLYSNTVDVQNSGPLEFPITADVQTSTGSLSEPQLRQGSMNMMDNNHPPQNYKSIQGKSILTHTCTNPQVQHIQIDIETDGMPCYAKVEVLQGPGEARQKFKVYTDDGSGFQGIIDIPYGYANCGSCTLIVTNEGPMEFPIKCALQEF